jgi:hypothetical protein
VATAVQTETLGQLQHTALLIHENWSYFLNLGRKNPGTRVCESGYLISDTNLTLNTSIVCFKQKRISH